MNSIETTHVLVSSRCRMRLAVTILILVFGQQEDNSIATTNSSKNKLASKNTTTGVYPKPPPTPTSTNTEKTLDIGKCSDGTWSSWKDRDNPSGNYDAEEITDFAKNHNNEFQETDLCSKPTAAQSRILGTTDMSTTENVHFGLNGLRCKNSEQPNGRCKDYEVRFCCVSRQIGVNPNPHQHKFPRYASCNDAGWSILSDTQTCFKIFTPDRYLTFDEAKDQCSSMSSHLVRIDSAATNQQISRSASGGIWISGTDMGHEGHWTDIFGNSLNYFNWSSHQPDNLSNKQHCAWINFEKVGAWDDIDCNHSGGRIHHYACQYDNINDSGVAFVSTNDTNQFIIEPTYLFVLLLLSLIGF